MISLLVLHRASLKSDFRAFYKYYFFISVQKTQYHYFINKTKSIKFSGTELEFEKIAIIKSSFADTILEKFTMQLLNITMIIKIDCLFLNMQSILIILI